MANDLMLRLSKCVLDHYMAGTDLYERKHCLFCGGDTIQQEYVFGNNQKGYNTIWVHVDNCPVPEAEDYVRNNS